MIPLDFSITFLGTSAASTSLNSCTSSCLVKVGRKCILIDAGIGTLRQLQKIKVNPEEIDIILITHWHIDHYAGLPAVLRKIKKLTSLSIYGPVIPLFTRLFLAILFHPFSKIYKTISEGFSRRYTNFILQAIPTSHSENSYGWAIFEKTEDLLQIERKIVISGDTRPIDNILHASRGADLLIHEATYLDKDAATAFIHQHSTAAGAAKIAQKSGVGALALTHIPERYSRLEVKVEAQEYFPQVFVPEPLDTIQLDPTPEGKTRENPGWAKIRIRDSSKLVNLDTPIK
jgi:ribonuclease Z